MKYNDNLTYPVSFGNGIREVSGAHLNRMAEDAPITLTHYQYELIVDRISELERKIELLTHNG